MKVYIDGKYYDERNARISVFDHGLLYGDGVFEGMRAYSGKVFRLKEHLDRLWASARAIMLQVPGTPEEMAKGKLGKGEAKDDSDIPAGSGAIVTRDGVKLACYREPSGELRECAAECTHMGAIVQWNDLEKTLTRLCARFHLVPKPARDRTRIRAEEPRDVSALKLERDRCSIETLRDYHLSGHCRDKSRPRQPDSVA